MRVYALLFLGCAFCTLGACTAPVETTDSFTVPQLPRAPDATRLRGCKLAIIEIADLRQDPSVVGTLGPRVVHGPSDPQAWMRHVLTSMKAYGADISFPRHGAVAGGELAASVSLVTAWVSSISTAKTGSVVVNVRYERDGSLVKETRYRGGQSDVNWFNSSDEIQGLIDDLLAKIVDAMSQDLVSLCPPASS